MSTASQGKPRRHLRPADERQHGISFIEVIVAMSILALTAVFVVPAIWSALRLAHITAATSAANSFASGQIANITAATTSTEFKKSDSGDDVEGLTTCKQALTQAAKIFVQSNPNPQEVTDPEYPFASDDVLALKDFTFTRDFGGRAGTLTIEQSFVVTFPHSAQKSGASTLSATENAFDPQQPSLELICNTDAVAPTAALATEQVCTQQPVVCKTGSLSYTVTVKLDEASGGGVLTTQTGVVPISVDETP